MQVVKSAGEVEQGRATDERQPLLGHTLTSTHGTSGDAPPHEEERKIDKKSFLTGSQLSPHMSISYCSVFIC